MEIEEPNLPPIPKENVFLIFNDFMTRFTNFEELVAVGNKLLVGFREGLEFLRRPPIDKTSELVECIIKSNETKRVLSYVEAGCVNTHDIIKETNKSKCVVNELEYLVDDARGAMESANEIWHKDNSHELDTPAATSDKASFDPQKFEVADYAAMMAILYSMVKQDYTMQEKIVSSLNLKSSSGELESYCLMWSLRPYVDDEVVHQAWRLIR